MALFTPGHEKALEDGLQGPKDHPFRYNATPYKFISDSRRRILPAGMPNIILKRRQK